MTSVLDLLAYLRAGGFTLTGDGERLIISPRDKLTPAECEQVRAAKWELLALLACERMAPCRRCRTWVDPQAASWVRRLCPRSDCPQPK